jgi:hypothetical protein
MFCQVYQLVKMDHRLPSFGNFKTKLGISKGSFHNGVFASACREDRFLTEDAIRKYHCTKFTTLMLAA